MRWPAGVQAGQGRRQGSGAELGGTTAAGHRRWPVRVAAALTVHSHRREVGEAGHEGPVDPLFPVPDPARRPQGQRAEDGQGPRAPRVPAAVAQQLQGPRLGPPGSQRPSGLAQAAAKVLRQHRRRPHRPDPRGGPGIGRDQAAVAAGEQPRMADHLQAAVGEHPAAARLHRQAGTSQPGGGVAAGAGQIRRELGGRMALDGDARLRQQPFAGPVRCGRTQMQLPAPQQQAAGQAAGAEGQGHLHGRGATAADHQLLAVLAAIGPGEEGLQGLDRHGAPRRRLCRDRRDGSHIEAEPLEAQRRPPRQLQLPGRRVEPADLRLHESDAREGAEAAQVDGGGLAGLQAGHHRRQQARVEGGAVAVHQADAGVRRPRPGPHQPAPQHQHVAVAAPGQDQLVAVPRGSHGGGAAPARAWNAAIAVGRVGKNRRRRWSGPAPSTPRIPAPLCPARWPPGGLGRVQAPAPVGRPWNAAIAVGRVGKKSRGPIRSTRPARSSWA